MNIIFLTVARVTDIDEPGIYSDLMREFRDNGHMVYIVSPIERRFKLKTRLLKQDGVEILNVRTFNIQRTNLVEKGIGTIFLEYQFRKAIIKYLGSIKFDLVLYSTPPITLNGVVKFIKKRTAACSYLLLKDIFPQNAVDLEMFGKKSLLHWYFRRKEKKLYASSDYIGTMSPANAEYLISHNPRLNHSKIEICPNSIKVVPYKITQGQKEAVRKKYGIPLNVTAFIYGGNLGKPQGIGFLLEVINTNIKNNQAFFVVVGSGSEYGKTQKWINNQQPDNAILIPSLVKRDYNELIQACDVGMIFLDKRFTIPNYPSRLLSYLENKMPVIAATDPITDIGKEAEKNNYGLWVLSGDIKEMNQHISYLIANPELVREMGKNGHKYLLKNFTVEKSYKVIMSHFSGNV